MNKYDSITTKFIDSMRYMEFVIVTFENLKTITELKFQADGNYSSVNFVIPIMFIKPMVPQVLPTFRLPISHP